MWRGALLGLVALVMAAGVFALWPRPTATPTYAGSAPFRVAPTTTVLPDPLTQPPITRPAGAAEQSSATTDSTSAIRIEDPESILRSLWVGWFLGIHHKDRQRIRDVVVLDSKVDEAVSAFGVDFTSEPRPEDIHFSDLEVLHSDETCLAVWARMTLSGFREGSTSGVYVLRWVDGRWKRLSTWTLRNDLWLDDCKSSLS